MHSRMVVINQCVILLGLTFSLVSTANGEEVAFGRLRGYTISNIMYYRNGEWVKPLLDWSKQESWSEFASGDQKSLGAYVSLVWGGNARIFSQWFRINATKPVTIRYRYAFVGGSAGDCSADSAIIHSDGGGDEYPGDGWVASKRTGFTWNDFEKISYVVLDPEKAPSYKGDNRIKPVPANLGALVTQIMSRWSELEVATVPKMRAKSELYEKLKSQLQGTPYFDFSIQRTVFADGKVTLLFFSARKFFHSPILFSPQISNDDSVGIGYRGWALIDQDGKISWPSAFVGLMPSFNSSVESYVSISPYALVELDGKQFLIAEHHEELAAAGSIETEVFELVNGKYRTRARYTGTCN